MAVHGIIFERSAAELSPPGGKLNPADVTTKALDKAVTVAHSTVISGQAPLPIPKGCKVWHGPVDKPREIKGT